MDKLSASFVKTKTRPGKYPDGGNLYLQIAQRENRAGERRITKAWLFRYSRFGKDTWMGLGRYPDVSLRTARELAASARAKRRAGTDPLSDKRSRRVIGAKPSFGECAEAYIKAHSPSWKNPKHKEQWRSRLARIRAHLDVRTSIDSSAFAADVATACRERIDSLLTGCQARCGEDVLEHAARHLRVHFEEVHADPDLARLEKKYLHEKKEIGFGQLSMQFKDPSVDALLFEGERAAADAPDRWVAVLNLRETAARAYWNRAHELTHRVAEPPQGNLRFYRHRNDRHNPLESLIDQIAAELAFYRTLFGPIIESCRDEPLTWELVDASAFCTQHPAAA